MHQHGAPTGGFFPCLVFGLDPPNPLALVVDTRRAYVRGKNKNMLPTTGGVGDWGAVSALSG